MADVQTIGQMDYEKVEGAAKLFNETTKVLKGIDAALQALLIILRTTAFIGVIGGYAWERYIANMQPPINKMSELSDKYAQQLRNADEKHKQRVAEAGGLFKA